MPISKNSNPGQTIILAGSGRSGTTWLGNIIAANPNIRIIFEPFDYRRVPQASILPLFPYARPEEEYPQWSAFVKDALTGNIENEWTNRQGKRRWARKRLVKAIRINLMLPWIDHMFNPKIVFTTRHPCAVVLSRMKLKWETHLDVFLSQPQLIEDYLEPFLSFIENANSEVARQAVMWCVENLIPLKQLPYHQWIFCSYEQLYRKPELEADRILNGLKIRKTWLNRKAINEVSMVARPDSSLVKGKDPLTEWQQKLSKEDITIILDTVASFEIALYGADVMPNLDSLVRSHTY